MRLRKSNQGKRFTSSLNIDLSDDEQAVLARQGRDSSDEEFVVDAKPPPCDQDEHDAGLQEGSDFESQDYTQSTPKRKKNKRSWTPGTGKPLSEVQPYPMDPAQKWTRTYVGPVRRWTRLVKLIEYWFGDEPNRKYIFDSFLNLWWDFEILPPKLSWRSQQLEMARNGWMPDTFTQDLEDKSRCWYDRYLSMRTISEASSLINRAEAFRSFLPQAKGQISVLLGRVSNQKEYHIKQEESIPFTDLGLPVEDGDNEELQNDGWLLDVGGIVLSMGWAPIKGEVNQLLAMAVIPFSDQAFYKDLNDVPKASDSKEGTVQIWEIEAGNNYGGNVRPSRSLPKLVHAVCFCWGRVTRMQWCPVPLTKQDQVGLMAVLCGDGNLMVFEVKRDPKKDSRQVFEEIKDAMVTIEPPKEHTLEINCFTWINMNRLAVGLSDGSVAVWSLSPRRQLQRHPIHSSPIMDIVSSYPSKPFNVATMPMGGEFTLTDLNRPTAEMTYHGNPLISLQPNVVAWSDHLRGFASIWPTSFPGTSTVSFVQSRVFPLSRHICTVEGQTTCLAFGACHPFLLAGSSDGSVWVLNVMRKIASHRERTNKLKVFQHEYHPPPTSITTDQEEEQVPLRGACRILHGFRPEANIHPLGTKIAKESKLKRSKKKVRKIKDKLFDDPAEVDEDHINMASGPIVVHEPLTRITALSWNPNAEFSWWAAAAMGSGLVRVMDLGIDTTEINLAHHNDQMELVDEEDVGEESGAADNGAEYEDEIEDDLDNDVEMVE